MRDYWKAAVFIVVLLLSVSLISAAIDILGDISDIDLSEEQHGKTKPAGTGTSTRVEGETVRVDSRPRGGSLPLFEIYDPPRTRYLRRSVGEIYDGGVWMMPEGAESVPYQGEDLEPGISGYDSVDLVSFSITPLTNISGFVPATLSIRQIKFLANLTRYPTLETYYSPAPIPVTYWISYDHYEFSEATLRTAELDKPANRLGVPEELSDRLGTMAWEIVGDAQAPWDQLKALEGYLKENYAYDEDYEPAPPNVDPVEWFLFNTTHGVCTHFNSAFVLLARSIGIPARVVDGYLVDAEAETQRVMPNHAHVYAEVPFEDLGWITFDATPERTEERPQPLPRTPTVTNITGNDARGVKGSTFKVHGTVTTLNGSAVDGLQVQVLLTAWKNETGVPCGQGEVVEGFFNITCDAAADLEVGDYMLVAHALGNALYEESWSDPPITIVAETEVFIEAPGRVHVGENVTLAGRVIDRSNGEGIANLTVVMAVGNETFTLVTDGDGAVSLVHAFDAEGNETVAMSAPETDYYLGSSGIVGIEVKEPPPWGILSILTVFPYNLMLAAASAASIGAVVLALRRRRPEVEERRPAAELIEEEAPLEFESYKEGIVKLFNRFYASTQRRYDEVRGSLTPREFQGVLLGKIPEGARALEELVTTFEIANYSEARPSDEDYDRCREVVEVLRGLMEDG